MSKDYSKPIIVAASSIKYKLLKMKNSNCTRQELDELQRELKEYMEPFTSVNEEIKLAKKEVANQNEYIRLSKALDLDLSFMHDLYLQFPEYKMELNKISKKLINAVTAGLNFQVKDLYLRNDVLDKEKQLNDTSVIKKRIMEELRKSNLLKQHYILKCNHCDDTITRFYSANKPTKDQIEEAFSQEEHQCFKCLLEDDYDHECDYQCNGCCYNDSPSNSFTVEDTTLKEIPTYSLIRDDENV